ncbi:phosphatidylserine decarboxylase family protein [bacterium]|nr:phosphatidylserine decarboxylase family protein [bacterium]
MRLPIATYGRRDCFGTVLRLVLVGAICAWGARALEAPLLYSGTALAGLVAAFWTSFYRDFERKVPGGEGLVVAPADGRITDIALVDEKEFLGGAALRIGIFLSPLNVHVNRSPAQGTVERVVHKPGKMLKAYDPRSADENESTLLGLSLDGGGKLAVRQVTGALARRIVCAASPGDRLARGERYGMIKLGSRTELLVPEGAGFSCAVKVGDMVRGGSTVLGTLPVPAPAAAPAASQEIGS